LIKSCSDTHNFYGHFQVNLGLLGVPLIFFFLFFTAKFPSYYNVKTLSDSQGREHHQLTSFCFVLSTGSLMDMLLSARKLIKGIKRMLEKTVPLQMCVIAH